MDKMKLQLFAANTTESNAPGNNLSAEMKTYYEKRLIDLAEPKLVHDQFGDKYPIPVGGGEFMLPIQGLAVLALLPIWLYNGEKGKHYRIIKPLCYWFYPVHILILALAAMFVLN